MLKTVISRSVRCGAVTFVAAAIAVLSGCSANSQSPVTQGGAYQSTRYAQPRQGLVAPSSTMTELAGGRPILPNQDWEYHRNDASLNPRASVQPPACQWVEFWQQERLRIVNGRPYESTTTNTRTWQLSPRR